MAYDQRSLDDYVDVAQRIADFREQYPEGSLQPADPGKPWEQATVTGYDRDGNEVTQTFIVYTAAAYRTPDDPRPGIGVAWEVFPGRTNFTRGSELMNGETSAWGRAIVAALASDSKKGVSSREEVRNRQAERDGDSHEQLREGTARGRVNGAKRGPVPPEQDKWTGQPAGQLPTDPDTPELHAEMDSKQRGTIMRRFRALGVDDADDQRAILSQITRRDVSKRNGLTYAEALDVIKDLQARPLPERKPTP